MSNVISGYCLSAENETLEKEIKKERKDRQFLCIAVTLHCIVEAELVTANFYFPYLNYSLVVSYF